MAVPFGFSVGDIIAGIGVIKNAISSFSDTCGASREYKLVSDTLDTLNQALVVAQGIQVDPIRDSQEHTAIINASERCQLCVNGFLKRCIKYDVLNSPSSTQIWTCRVKVAVRKIQWALCKKGDLQQFRDELQQQVDSISFLIATLQV
jgi:hypothetical protein